MQLEMYTPPYGSPYLTQHYYYYLRDHLGSIRAVFDEQLDEGHGQPWFPPGGPINGRTSASSARSSLRSSQTATMELAAAWVEDTLYPGVAQARSYSPDEAYGGNYVARLGGALRWGPGRSLPVSRGDSVHAQVFALAEQEASATLRRAAPRIGLFFTGVAGLFGSGERRAARPGPGLGFVLPLSGGTPGRAARQGQGEGALNYAFYDRDSALVSYGRLPLEDGQADWQQLSLDLEAGQEGYVYVYLSGESSRYTLFDEMSVAVYSRKVELKAYYPYGREIADLGYKSPSWRGDPFAFTGKPRLDWAGLPMQDFGARMYDSQTGRWNGADPLAENGMAWSPFAYCFDSPSTHIDPDGRWAGLIDYKKFHHNKGSGNPAESAQEDDAGWPGGPDGQAELAKGIATVQAVFKNLPGELKSLIAGVKKSIADMLGTSPNRSVAYTDREAGEGTMVPQARFGDFKKGDQVQVEQGNIVPDVHDGKAMARKLGKGMWEKAETIKGWFESAKGLFNNTDGFADAIHPSPPPGPGLDRKPRSVGGDTLVNRLTGSKYIYNNGKEVGFQRDTIDGEYLHIVE